MSNPYLDLMPIVADRGWRLIRGYGSIRDEDGRCPICALANEIDPDSREQILWWRALANVCVAQSTSAAEIVLAADDPNHLLRPALMAALGMKL